MASRRGGALTAVARWVAVVVVAFAAGWSGSALGRADSTDGEGDDGSLSDVVVTAEVERRELAVELRGRGDVVSSSSSLVAAPLAPEGAAAIVVTRVPLAVGDAVPAGGVVVELNGRPVLALAGALPVYRDLRPDDSGPDVAQVQVALRAVGASIPASEDGRFGEATQRAVEKMYGAAGYAPRYTGSTRAEVDALLDEAGLARDVARAALTAAEAEDPAGVPAARAALAAAESELRRVRATNGVVLPGAEVVTVSELPGVLIDRPVEAGAKVDPGLPVAVVGSTGLLVEMELTAAQTAELDEGASATVGDPALGYESTCTLDAARELSGVAAPAPAPPVGDGGGAPGEPAGGGSTRPGVRLLCDPAPSLEMIGVNVPVVVRVPRSSGPVLVVPTSALAAGASGATHLEVVGAGRVRRVEVRVGREAAGLVEVTPVGDATLREGAPVRVRHR